MPDALNIALLIDADNTQLTKLDTIISYLNQRGTLCVRRAYGNWSKSHLSGWPTALNRHGIKAEQQFDYAIDKNATDMAMTIDALDLLYTGTCNCFALASSDCDFTPLAIRLREGGKYVMGFGRKQTPEAFRNSCTEFVCLEQLEPQPATTSKAAAPASPPEPTLTPVPQVPASEPKAQPAPKAPPSPTPSTPSTAKSTSHAPTKAEVQELLSTELNVPQPAKDAPCTKLWEVHALLRILSARHKANGGAMPPQDVNLLVRRYALKHGQHFTLSRLEPGYTSWRQFFSRHKDIYELVANKKCYRCLPPTQASTSARG